MLHCFFAAVGGAQRYLSRDGQKPPGKDWPYSWFRRLAKSGIDPEDWAGDVTDDGGISADLHLKSNFSCRIKLFLPVQSHPKKYSGFPKPQITFISRPSRPTEGRWPSSQTRGGMRWTRAALLTRAPDSAFARTSVDGYQVRRRLWRRRSRTEKSCGPDASTLASSRQPRRCR